ncbi:MAG: translation initiation factor IF-5A [Candidatus Woesearchaeota archaeon]
MGEIKLEEATQLKKGSCLIIDNEACKVVELNYSKPGKHGHAKINLMAVGLIDGKKRNVVMPGHAMVEIPIIEKRNAQVLSISGDVANVMDTETFETFEMKVPEDIKGTLVEGCTVLYWFIMDKRVMKQVMGKE